MLCYASQSKGVPMAPISSDGLLSRVWDLVPHDRADRLQSLPRDDPGALSCGMPQLRHWR